MGHLKNNTVFITGASSGIGRACADFFAAAGARLILCARRFEKLKKLFDELVEKYGIEVQTAQLDVSDSTAVHQFVHGLPDEWQQIDILINNAGKALGLGASFTQTLAHIDGMLDTNPVRGTKSSLFGNSLRGWELLGWLFLLS